MSYRDRDYEYNIPFKQRLNIPIQHVSTNLHYDLNEQPVQNRIHHNNTTVQWINDPITNREKFRVTINIAGFNQDEVHIRVDGSQLFIYGEHIENKSQGTAKKVIEKSYDLSPDVDVLRPHVTFPLPTTMQVDFPSRHSNTAINHSRNSSRHSLSPFPQTNGYISTRKLDDYDKIVSNIVPVIHTRSPFEQKLDINSRYFSNDHPSSIIRSNSPIYSFRPSTNDKTDHRRSYTPTLSTEDNFNFNRRSMTSSFAEHQSLIFPEDFDSDVFYRSSFHPQIFTDDRDQRYIEMKLDVHDYNPNDINVSINDNDLIVQVKHRHFYKKLTLPSNTDLTSLSLQHHHDKKLYITAKLLDEYSSLKYI